MMVDVSTGQTLFARNIDRRFMPASITKVMTAYLAFELLDQKKLLASQSYRVRPETWDEWYAKGSNMFIPEDARVSVDNLIHGITTVSANDGAVVLAEGAAGSVDHWTAMMNEKARELGMTNTHYNSPNGWMDEGKTFVTARDLVKLAEAMITRHNAKFRHFVGHPTFTYNDVTQRNHDPLIGKIEGADGIKTGFTNEAGYGYLGTASRNGRRLVIVVAGADRASVRDKAARAFIEWGFTQFDRKMLFAPGQIIADARVQDGSERRIGLTSLKPVRIDVPLGTNPRMEVAVVYDGPVRAPFAAHERIAQLEVHVEGMPTSRIPLVAAAGVEKAGFFTRIVNGIIGWFA